MDPSLKREIILEHYQNPKNKGITNEQGFEKVNMNNDSCIDEVDVEIKIEDNIIKHIHFDGEACAICTSSSSIMTETLKGKTLEEANNIIDNFYNMIDDKEYDKDVLEQACVYDDIAKQPNRKKCALLAWWGAEKIVKREK